jgi:hypothetical protein
MDGAHGKEEWIRALPLVLQVRGGEHAIEVIVSTAGSEVRWNSMIVCKNSKELSEAAECKLMATK